VAKEKTVRKSHPYVIEDKPSTYTEKQSNRSATNLWAVIAIEGEPMHLYKKAHCLHLQNPIKVFPGLAR